MKLLYSLLAASCFAVTGFAQTNMLSTNPVAEQVMLGKYDPGTYVPPTVVIDPAVIANGIQSSVSADSMHAYLDVLRSFQNRNTGSDTISTTKGIGAARRWVFNKFMQFSAQRNNRLVTSYFQFDKNICSIDQHRNIFAVLPGSDTASKEVIIIEAHIDSRCAGLCDTACLAEGMEDNGSGTALVIELARVMSMYSFKHTIVFMPVIGEEQSLAGSDAFARYAKQKGIKIKAVLNNDVVGGILCGKTASPPGCPGLNDVDSAHVRLFSSGAFNSPHKGLARYIKLQYKEMLQSTASVPMGIHIMTDEDRIGRGGDHIPFRQQGFPAMRFTSANEHGDADVTAPGYDDRQHTSADILGVDTDADTKLDSFFVNFNYLARNTVINGNAAAMMALGTKTPDFSVSSSDASTLSVNILSQQQYLHYRIGLRTTSNDWDSVYTFTGSTSHTLSGLPQATYIVSVAAVDDKGTESLFSREVMLTLGINKTQAVDNGIELLQNTPNPADETTMITVVVKDGVNYKDAFISITDINGRQVKKMPVTLTRGVNEVLYEHGYNVSGTYVYTLYVDGKPIQSKRMVFNN